MKLDSKLFDRIRIKPPEAETAEEGEPVCQWQGCERAGAYRAPMGRLREGQYFHFCIDHVRDYNKSYNYFAGMPPDAIDAYQKDSVTGHRPTWKMGVKGAEKADRAERPGGRWNSGINDMFGFFGGYRADQKSEQSDEQRRPTKQLERKSFATLDLEGGESRAEIKARFKELVKRLHPDANGGDRSTEDRLREIIQAYNHLKAAGFC